MGAFDALRIAGSSLGMHQTWLDALAHNIANANTVRAPDEDAFQHQRVVAAARPEGGVDVSGIELGDAEGRLAYDPEHPLADEDGMVRQADVDMGDQLTQLMVAQRAYQLNLAVVDRAKEAYQQALRIGQ